MPPNKTTLTEGDTSLWSLYVKNVRRLPNRKSLAIGSATTLKPQPVTVPIEPKPLLRLRDDLSETKNLDVLMVGIAPRGLDKSTWRRLQTGQIRPDRQLDLHGFTLCQAFARFQHVLVSASKHGQRCLEVVTGRGTGEYGGALRRELPLWINLTHLRPLILAASHPHPDNPGSVRLLLRRYSHIRPRSK